MDPNDGQWLEGLTAWMTTHRVWILPCVSAFACLEALFLLGLFVSSVILVTVATTATVKGGFAIPTVAAFAFAGAFLGDNLGYWLGRSLSASSEARLARAPERLRKAIERAEQWVVKSGPGAIVLGRFLPPIRSVVPFVVGVSGMPGRRYLLFDLAACAVWSLCLALIVSGVEILF